jgi:hypothetical protein
MKAKFSASMPSSRRRRMSYYYSANPDGVLSEVLHHQTQPRRHRCIGAKDRLPPTAADFRTIQLGPQSTHSRASRQRRSARMRISPVIESYPLPRLSGKDLSGYGTFPFDRCLHQLTKDPVRGATLGKGGEMNDKDRYFPREHSALKARNRAILRLYRQNPYLITHDPQLI